ncbi:MAG: hypothetical protein JW821_20555 [Deltaproteobacteria bacterium]|nr:hypothetical protein [Deltaproteobacteria bacterium]
MKINLKIEGLPQLYKLMNKKKDLEFEFPGSTLQDFVNGLVRKFGPGVRKAILDQKGEIDMELRVVRNFQDFLSYGERMDVALNEGDTLHLMTVG